MSMPQAQQIDDNKNVAINNQPTTTLSTGHQQQPQPNQQPPTPKPQQLQVSRPIENIPYHHQHQTSPTTPTKPVSATRKTPTTNSSPFTPSDHHQSSTATTTTNNNYIQHHQQSSNNSSNKSTTTTTTTCLNNNSNNNHQHQHHQHQNRMQSNDCQSAILTYQQVRRLHLLMEQLVPIHGRGSFPALQVRLRDLICRVTEKLRARQINIRDIRLNGGAASYVLAPEKAHYNDLDLIFATDLNDESKFDVIRDAVLDCLRELHIEQHSTTKTTTTTTTKSDANGQNQGDGLKRTNEANIEEGNDDSDNNIIHQEDDITIVDKMPRQQLYQQHSLNQNQHQSLLDDCAIKEAYVHKMVKVNDEDRWSLISMGVHQPDIYLQPQQHDNMQMQMNHQHHPMIVHQQQQIQQQQQQQQAAALMAGNQKQQNELDSFEPIDEFSSASSVCSSAASTYSGSSTSSASSRCSSASCSSGSSIFSAPSTYLMGQYNYHQYQQQHHHQHHQNQQRQFPNSIELKFVDRMRRKFEFSVDSFQIILDSLMDFYQFAPETTTSLTSTPNRLKISAPATCTSNKNQQKNSSIINTLKTGKLNGNHNKNNYHNHGSPPTSHPDSPDQDYHQWTSTVDGASSNASSVAINCDQQHNNTNKIPIDPSSPILENSDVVVGGDDNAKGKINSVAHEVDILQTSYRDITSSKNNNNNNQHHSTTCQERNLKSTTNENNPSSSRSESSSSGCSSSSSVVSSSSSSLSFEDDEEGDFENVDAFSIASSSQLSSVVKDAKLSPTSFDGDNETTTTTIANKLDADVSNLSDVTIDQASLEPTVHVDESTSNKSIKSQVDTLLGEKIVTTKVQNAELITRMEELCLEELKEEEDGEKVKHIINDGREKLAEQKTSDCDQQENQIKTAPIKNSESSTTTYHIKNKINQHIRMSYPVISENFYPTVVGRSEYGNFNEALNHLEKKLIATRNPEQIRGGGLLKYCNLLVKNYKPTNLYQIRKLERYMCSRFFIDFCDLNQQQAKLESYLANHFSNDPILKFDYLTILHNVVQRSTVCLMNHELRVTLNMIRDLAYKLNDNQLLGPEHRNLIDHHQQAAIIYHHQQQHQQHQQQQNNHFNYKQQQQQQQQQQHQHVLPMDMYNTFHLVHQQQQQNNQRQHQAHQSKSSQRQQHNQRNNTNTSNSANVNSGAGLNAVTNPMVVGNPSIPTNLGLNQHQTTVNYFEHQRPPVILQSGVYRVKMVIA